MPVLFAIWASNMQEMQNFACFWLNSWNPPQPDTFNLDPLALTDRTIHVARTEVAECCLCGVNAICSHAELARQPTIDLATEVPAHKAVTWPGLQES